MNWIGEENRKKFTTEAHRSQRVNIFNFAVERTAKLKILAKKKTAISIPVRVMGFCFFSSQGKAKMDKSLCSLCLCGEIELGD